MKEQPTSQKGNGLGRRRSRVLLAVLLIAVVVLSILAAVLIQRGLDDEDLQRELQELRDQGL